MHTNVGDILFRLVPRSSLKAGFPIRSLHSEIHRRGMQSVRSGFGLLVGNKGARMGRNCENESRKAIKSLGIKVFVRPWIESRMHIPEWIPLYRAIFQSVSVVTRYLKSLHDVEGPRGASLLPHTLPLKFRSYFVILGSNAIQLNTSIPHIFSFSFPPPRTKPLF